MSGTNFMSDCSLIHCQFTVVVEIMSATMLIQTPQYQLHAFPYKPGLQFPKANSNKCRLALHSGILRSIYQRPFFNVSVMEVAVPAEMEEQEFWINANTYAPVLEICVRRKSLVLGKQTHASILKTGHEQHIFLQTKLILMYAKCGSMIYARLIFDRMQNPDVYAFTPIIVEYVRQKYYKETLALFYQMHKACVRQDDLIFSSALKSCVGLEALQQGKEVHAHVMKCGFASDLFVGNSLVVMYTKCGSLEDAWQVFVGMPQRNKVSWNAMISGYAQNGKGHEAGQLFRHMQLVGEKPNSSTWTAIISGYAQNGCWYEALKIFGQMQLANVEPNTRTLANIMQACGRLNSLENGRQIHGFIIRKGVESDVFVANALVGMYSKCRGIENACQVFDKMYQRNVLSWNVMIAAYAQNGILSDALELFDQMQTAGVKPNLSTMNTLIAGCAENARCDKALEFFSDMQLKGLKPSVISWTAIITGYAQNGHVKDALNLFNEMVHAGVKPNSNTIAGVLRGCSGLASLQQGKGMHAYIIKRGFESNVFVGSALVDMYGKCGNISSALLVFDKMPEKNVVTWNSIIARHALNGHVDDALKLFAQMLSEEMKPDAFTWNAMIAGYAQNGQVEEASKLFSQMQVEGMKPSVISWTSIIAGYAQNCQSVEALNLFNQMLMMRMKPNLVTILTVLPACASLAALEQGHQIHGYAIRSEFESDVVVGTALIDMYAKCGSIKDARCVFNKLSERNLFTWNSMITGHALNGNGKDAISLFHQMIQKDIKPDSITFTGVLSGCSRSGLLDEGWHYFDSMGRDYGITPNLKHYSCMVDLLGRGGYLDEAWDFIKNMPLEPNASVWGALLNACKTHLNVDLGERAAKHLFQIEPHNAANYVLLSNIYALAGRWDDIRAMREVMKDMGVKKRLGWSWIKVKNQVHTFFVGDRSHPQMAEIHASLQNLSGQMKKAGYVPDTNCVLQNVDEKEKEHILYSHSEKLAIAFGLINTYPGTPLRIIRNLRVCGDCHTASKFISKIASREIFIRDRHRFHHFKDGLCSCGDYW